MKKILACLLACLLAAGLAGCSGGGGQPIHDGYELAGERGENLYFLDKNAKIRFSHENPDIRTLYQEYMGEPGGKRAHQLLHTEHRI